MHTWSAACRRMYAHSLDALTADLCDVRVEEAHELAVVSSTSSDTMSDMTWVDLLYGVGLVPTQGVSGAESYYCVHVINWFWQNVFPNGRPISITLLYRAQMSECLVPLAVVVVVVGALI